MLTLLSVLGTTSIMSKKANTKAKALAYLKKEEEYLRDLKRFVENELFRLQIEELNLSAALRSQRVKSEKDKLTDSRDQFPEQESVLPTQNATSFGDFTGNQPQAQQVLEPLDLDPNHASALEQEDLWN